VGKRTTTVLVLVWKWNEGRREQQRGAFAFLRGNYAAETKTPRSGARLKRLGFWGKEFRFAYF